MPRIHLVVGPVGAGKSTFARSLGRRHGAPRLTLDQWMTVLFSPDRPDTEVFAWYRERTERCIEQIYELSEALLQLGKDVVLEIGLILQRDRLRFYERLATRSHEYVVYVLDAPRDIRRERVEQRNLERGETFSMQVPADIFELASDLWEPPDDEESAGRHFEYITTWDGHFELGAHPKAD